MSDRYERAAENAAKLFKREPLVAEDGEPIDPFQGPVIPVELLRERVHLAKSQEENDSAAEMSAFFSSMQAKAQAEIDAWAALPCGGEVDRVHQCSDAFESTCERREWLQCPRRKVKVLAEDERQARKERRSTLVSRGYPERVLRAVVDVAPLETEAMRLLREAFSEMPAPSIVVLQGGVGCGKTCAAGWWGAQHLAQFVSVSDLSKISPYDEDGQGRLRGRHLVIDDLGAEYLDPKGFFLANLDAVIDHRYSRELPTVITTNQNAAEFKRRYDNRIADRIREAGRFIQVGGNSLRTRK